MSSLLPPNATPQERALEAAMVRQLPVLLGDIWNPDTCPEALLPWLAWELSVDTWNPNWTEAQKRGAVRASIPVHQKKGTIGAVQEAVTGLGYEAEITEWFQLEPAGDPYTFEVDIAVGDDGIPDIDAYREVESVTLGAKNLRSHLLGVNTTMKVCGNEYVGAGLQIGMLYTVGAEPGVIFLQENLIVLD